MVRHVVLFRFHEGVTDEEVERLAEAFSTLPVAIPEIHEYAHGRDLDIVEGTWDYALVADFATRDDYEVYATHVKHLAVLTDVVQPITADKARAQFEV